MRVVLLLIAMVFLLVEFGGAAKPAPTIVPSSSASAAVQTPEERVDFDTQVKPIFQSKCMPCHFSGGQMYDRLPFDQPATIKKLGFKVFTRIKEENDRKLIEDFLTQSP